MSFRRQSSAEEYTHIFVSPHFDDAVLSCGGLIHQLITSGQIVRVMTMMAGLFHGELPDTPILADLHERWSAGTNPLVTRQGEDMDALKSLGAHYTHIPLTDCVYRVVDGVALYPSEESLFGMIHPADYAPAFLRDVGLPFRDAPKTVYIPLGVGHHVDHQIVRDWGLRLLHHKPDHITIRFYGEYPYLNAEKSIDAALEHFSILLTPNNVILDEEDMRAKLDAIGRYQSQISTFWQGIEAMHADVRQSSRHPHTGEYIERYWDIS